MVRSLTAEDAEEMARIHKDAFPVGWPVSDMVRHTQKDLCLGIGVPLSAFIILQIAGEQADILTLATDSQARRKGHACKLLRSAQEYLENKSIRTIFLDVAENNSAAIGLYKSCGFQAIGRRPAYYRTSKGRIAAITFSKSL